MFDFLSVLDYKVQDLVDAIAKTTKIHDVQRTRGVVSQIGMLSGHYINLQMPHNIVVVGDIHGDFVSLENIMGRIDFKDFLKNDSNTLIFLGDYIDRGEYSIEVLLFLCKLKILYPGNVFLLRGNHESYDRFPFSSYDFYPTLVNKIGKPIDTLYNNTILPFFESLFLFCEISGFSILTHGGLPVIEDPLFFRNYKSHLSNSLENNALLEEILWNDPRDLPDDKRWSFSNRGLGKYFGVDVTNTWLSNTGCKFLIRGHEPCKGYKLIHENKVLTIFSSKAPYPKFESSYLKISKKEIGELDGDGSSISQYVHIV